MNRAGRALTACVLAGLVACTGAATDHEGLGDRAYLDRNYTGALVEYQLALRQNASDVGLRRKAGMSALNARDLGEAAVQFLALGQQDEGQAIYAADGLERVARLASSGSNRSALQVAIEGLQEVAPGRALGSFARELAAELVDAPATEDGLDILRFAAAAAPDARLQDSLMFVYAVTLVRLGRCEPAVPVFESVLRRQRESAVLEEAQTRAAACGNELGRRYLNRGIPDDAEQWFDRAVAVGDNNYPARLAYLGLGDARFARGNYEAAADAFRRAMIGGTETDSISQVAQRGLDRVAGFVPFDTLGTRQR